MLICSCAKIRRAWLLLALAPVMDPERDGYISLEEESTTSPQQCADCPKEDVPLLPRPEDDDAVLSEGSTAELVRKTLSRVL